MDKRDLSSLFRERLKTLVRRSDLNQSAFAAAVGIDRSALSQLLSGATTRLPRAETLLNIASENKVSLDWLLGLSQDEGLTGEIRASFELEEASGGFDRTLLARWHAEAAGTKIRYVPAGIPDLLRTEALIEYEAGITNKSRESQADETRYRIDYSRRPETDMEVCMPLHTLDIFARGLGVWAEFPASASAQSSSPICRACSTTSTRPSACSSTTAACAIPCPTRSSARSARRSMSATCTWCSTPPQPVTALTRHFDNLIRAAIVNAHESAAFAQNLLVSEPAARSGY